MDHYIAYHNRTKMGRKLADGDALAVVSTRPLSYLLHNRVWFVEGNDSPDGKQYLLSSTFIVSEHGAESQGPFHYFAKGSGRAFDPPIILNGFDWFLDLRKSMANFSLGVRKLVDNNVLENLLTLAGEAG